MTTSQRSSGRHALQTADAPPYAIPHQATRVRTQYPADTVWTAPTPADYLPTVTVTVPAQRPAVDIPPAQAGPSRAAVPAIVEPRKRQVLTYLLAGAVVLIAVIGTAVNIPEPATATTTVTTPVSGPVQP